MKSTYINISAIIFIILTVLNPTTLIELSKNQDISNFYYKNIELPDNYTQKEKEHMQDVKNLVNFSVFLNIIFLITTIILPKYSKPNLKIIGNTLITLPIISIIISSISYQFVHDVFHAIFFTSNTWLFPADSILIQTYPLTYFRNIFLLITGILLVLGLIIRFIIFKRIQK